MAMLLPDRAESFCDGRGALPNQAVQAIADQGAITGRSLEGYFSPASLDLPLSEVRYRVDGLTYPRKGQTVEELIRDLNGQIVDPDRPMERGVTYFIRSELDLDLRGIQHVYGYANPRSNTGRDGIVSRLLADGVSNFNGVSSGYHGALWTTVTPNSFPIIVGVGDSLNQLRFFNQYTIMTDQEYQREFVERVPLAFLSDGTPLSFDDAHAPLGGDLLLSLDLGQEVVGYECRGTNEVLDRRKGKGAYAEFASHFFTPIVRPKNMLHVRNGSLYILATYEYSLVPPWAAGELVRIDERYGDQQTHDAGFIDPYWGTKTGTGRPITLEIRPFGTDLYLWHRMPIGRMRYERMSRIPTIDYDKKTDSDFTEQRGAKLSKFFSE